MELERGSGWVWRGQSCHGSLQHTPVSPEESIPLLFGQFPRGTGAAFVPENKPSRLGYILQWQGGMWRCETWACQSWLGCLFCPWTLSTWEVRRQLSASHPKCPSGAPSLPTLSYHFPHERLLRIWNHFPSAFFCAFLANELMPTGLDSQRWKKAKVWRKYCLIFENVFLPQMLTLSMGVGEIFHGECKVRWKERLVPNSVGTDI